MKPEQQTKSTTNARIAHSRFLVRDDTELKKKCLVCSSRRALWSNHESRPRPTLEVSH